MSLASKITFQRFCEVLEDILVARGNKKIEILKKFLDDCRNLGRKLKAEHPDADVSLFPILRLLLVKNDKERGPHGLKELTLGKLYIRVFCLGTNSPEAKKIANYRQPSGEKSQINDFAERIYWILKSRLRNSSNLSIEQVNVILDKIAEKNSLNEAKDNQFLHFQKCSCMEVKWFTRIILKDIKAGMGEKSIFEAYHPDAAWFFGEKSNLRKVCDTLINPQLRLHRNISNISPLSPFKPMLLERLTIEEIGKLFKNTIDAENYIVQTKFDGERSQMHMKNGSYKYFTRHGLDITENSGFGCTKTATNAFLTKKIADLLNPMCHSIILDGELMGWHKEKRILGSKGMNYDVKKLTSRSNYQPCFMAFDIILYNDQLLINHPLKERLKILETAFQQQDGVLMHANNISVTNQDAILKVFNESLDKGDEGIVIKKSDSLYKPNSREGNCCYKLKAEYSDGLIEDIDMLILGGYYGEKKYAGMISSFLMGVSVSQKHNKKNAENFHNLRLLSVVSVGSGLSAQKIAEINQRFKDLWTKECPENVVAPKKYLPDVWIEPEKSLVLQLRATEMIRCDYHPSGYTLRFPRVLKSREDKPWTDVCSLNELKSLIKTHGVVQKLTKRHATASDVDSHFSLLSPSKRQREAKEEMFLKHSKIDVRYFGVNSATVQRKTRLFEDKKVCVINGEEKLLKFDGADVDEKWTKADIERILISHSAQIVQNPGKDTFCLIVGNENSVKVQTHVDCRNYNVTTLNWVRRAIDAENWSKLVDFYPWELLSFRQSIKNRLIEQFDEYYDSFTQDTDEESLRRSFERVRFLEDDVDVDLSAENCRKISKNIFRNEVHNLGVFQDIVGYFVDESDWCRHGFVFMRGKISETIDSCVTHVFVNNSGNNMNTRTGDVNLQLCELYEVINERGNPFVKVIDSGWINDCIEKHELLSEVKYLIN